jgi:hypothetical protein
MDSELKEKSLKLLADPRKLKHIRYTYSTYDPFKHHLECKLKYKCNETFYNHIVQLIEQETIVYKKLIDIIDLVSLYHSP